MKILIVNKNDIQGGAARAAYRLHKALLGKNIDSQMLVLSKSSDDFTVNPILKKNRIVLSKLRSDFDSIPVRRYSNKTLFSVAWVPSSGIAKKINKLNPDVVHLHWINGGMLRIEDLARIEAPIVWSLHDMWAFTGGCHYDRLCGAYKNRCGACIVLESKNTKDISSRIFSRKQKTYSKIANLTIVGLSSWLEACAANSALFHSRKIVNIPNPIDTGVFRAFDKLQARKLWGLPESKKLVLFGAMGATSDPRKGFSELSDAVKNIDRDDIEFVVFGATAPLSPPDTEYNISYVGRLYDDVSLVTLYSAVDVTIVPSKQENLSNVIMESLACETPVVGFDIGGNSDLIEHKSNGYLAQPFDPTDLAHGIEWLLDSEKYSALCVNARIKVMQDFDSNIVAKKYVQLYREIISD